jgi:spoIIIJ-associated protein
MDENQSLEYTGDTVDEAVAKGLSALGASPSDIIVEVIEEASRGILGIGARPARVRLKMLRKPAPPPPPAPEPAPVPEPHAEQPKAESTPPRSKPRRERERRAPSEMSDDDAAAEEQFVDYETAEGVDDSELDDEGRIAKEVLLELLAEMDVTASIRVTRAQADEDEKAPWLLNIEGRKVNMLIGRRGDVLASLQYIVRLMTSRRLQKRSNVVIDVDGYKARRSRSLRELAVRMADQAVRQERTITLEPMPPHERRMIHMALRSRGDVFTRSTGDGEGRKVTIVPK